jgi:hypothetical protein
LPKASQQHGEPEEILREGIGRDPPGDSACSDSRVAGASQGLRWVRMAILCDITINENLKLMQINYLAQKVDFFLFYF